VLLATAGCGGGERQDASEAEAEYAMEITDVSFPKRQGIAETVPFRATVRNVGDRTVPNVAMTLDGFSFRQQNPADADPQRPLWIVNAGPEAGTTAYVNTWALGPLRAGQERTFTWSVTAVEPGTHTLRYQLAAGLHGNAKALTADDQIPEGTLTVTVTRRPREATVDPKTGKVTYKGE
jgi:hypothetical protein